MKLMIELSEKDVQIKLDEFLSERIAKITDDYIRAKVAEVIDKKVERANLPEMVEKSARALFTKTYGEPGTYNTTYGRILTQVAETIIKEQLKKVVG